ncbi:hypothetical protein V3F58_22900, partial [Pseudomonas putida]
SGRMRVEWVAGSPWNRWSDAHGMGGQMTVKSANHGTDRLAYWHNLHGNSLAERSLHGRVIEIAGHRMAARGHI